MAHPKEFAEGLPSASSWTATAAGQKNRGLPRTAGHKKGAEVFSDIADYCDELGVSSVYFYAFSTENWKRPLEEVNAIMRLFGEYLLKGFDYKNRNIRIKFMGDRTVLDHKLQQRMNKLEAESSVKTGMTLNIAINYGGRPEIVRAAQQLAAKAAAGQMKPGRDHRTDAQRCHVHRRAEGPGLYPASQRRKAAVQLHALAGRLCGAGGNGRSVAGFYPCRPGRRH